MLFSSMPSPILSITILAVSVVFAFLLKAIRNLYLHPLAMFHGPRLASSTSLVQAFVSYVRREPEWMMSLAQSFGTNQPIRITPSMLFFPQPEAVKQIYWDADMNRMKSDIVGTGVLGPPHLFTTRDGEEHRNLRKALGGPQWSIGALKNKWEARIDEVIQLLMHKLSEQAGTGAEILLADRLAGFAADIMTTISFSKQWGFVSGGRDERGLLESWRAGMDWVGFVNRWQWLRGLVQHPLAGYWLLPRTTDKTGIGYLIAQADREVTEREAFLEVPEDFMQYCLDAQIDQKPLSPVQKRAHVTLLIQAGADTTGSALGSTVRFLLTHPDSLLKMRGEIDFQERDGNLSTPVSYEESQSLLPYTGACIKESLRLHPPATIPLARLTPPQGKVIGGVFVPGGTEVTTHAWVVQRDPDLYAPDPESFRPERWIHTDGETLSRMEAGSFVFGMGARACLGKDIALMELCKLIPELVRKFDFELMDPGKYVVAGGLAYNKDFRVKLWRR